MKTLFRMIALFTLLFCISSCGDDDELAPESMEVNYANIAGTWRLTEWNGEKIDEPRYSYITFNRKAEDGKRAFMMYTNLNSAVSERVSGAFNLGINDDSKDIISGTYDYTLSTNDGWEHIYVITGLDDKSMIWTAEDDAEEVRVYTRCGEVPADIVVGTRAVSH